MATKILFHYYLTTHSISLVKATRSSPSGAHRLSTSLLETTSEDQHVSVAMNPSDNSNGNTARITESVLGISQKRKIPRLQVSSSLSQ